MSRQQNKIGRQVNKERNRHARKPPYIHTHKKVFIHNYLERIGDKFTSKFTSKFMSKQKIAKSRQGLRAPLSAYQFSVSLYSSICSTEATLNFNFSISYRISLPFLFIFGLQKKETGMHVNHHISIHTQKYS